MCVNVLGVGPVNHLACAKKSGAVMENGHRLQSLFNLALRAWIGMLANSVSFRIPRVLYAALLHAVRGF